MQPMLAVPADAGGLPDDPDRWAYEVKWDGIRVLAEVRDGRLRPASRRGNDVSAAWPDLAGLGGVLPDGVLLDGEIVVLAGGVPSFPAIAERMHVRDDARARALAAAHPATLVLFDVLRTGGTDVVARPWTERRALLADLLAALPAGSPALLSPVYDDRDALVAATREQGLEGVVAKRRASRYTPGSRSPDWVKFAHRRTVTCLVGGWRPESNGSGRIGALLVGLPDGAGGLRFAGRVGAGLTAAAAQAQLAPLLRERARATPPFSTPVPREDARGTTWTDPTLPVEVRHLGHVEGERLRQPVFLGVRADLTAREVRDGR